MKMYKRTDCYWVWDPIASVIVIGQCMYLSIYSCKQKSRTMAPAKNFNFIYSTVQLGIVSVDCISSTGTGRLQHFISACMSKLRIQVIFYAASVVRLARNFMWQYYCKALMRGTSIQADPQTTALKTFSCTVYLSDARRRIAASLACLDVT